MTSLTMYPDRSWKQDRSDLIILFHEQKPCQILKIFSGTSSYFSLIHFIISAFCGWVSARALFKLGVILFELKIFEKQENYFHLATFSDCFQPKSEERNLTRIFKRCRADNSKTFR